METKAGLKGLFKVILVGAAALVWVTSAFGAEWYYIYPGHDNFWTGRVKANDGSYSKHNEEIMYGSDQPDGRWQGWVKLDLSGVPDNVTFLDASMCYEVISQSNPGPHTYLTLVDHDPVTADPEMLWNDILTGEVIAPDTVTDKGWVERPLNAAGLAALQAALAQDWVAFGFYKWDDAEAHGHAKGYAAQKFRPRIKVTILYSDMAIRQILAPVGYVNSESLVVPSAAVANVGQLDGPFQMTFKIMTAAEGDELYSQTVDVPGLAPGDSTVVEFPAWAADTGGGQRLATCTLDLAYDANPADNFAVEWFNVVNGGGGGGGGGGGEPPTVFWGWQEVKPVPMALSGKPVRSGGTIAVDPTTGLVYCFKGNKSVEFFGYDPLEGAWRQLAQPTYGKAPGSGSHLVCDGKGKVYLVKGANTSEFWVYDIALNQWQQLFDVPLGNSGKKVKGGTDLVHVEQYGLDYIYMLKGPKCDFLRYNVQAQTWAALPNSPPGTRGKWDRGSFLAYDGQSHLYAHRANIHEMWSYDIDNDAWQAQMPGMPYLGAAYRPRKSKDGACATWKEGALYSLKGGNTSEFWTFSPATGNWQELEPMPEFGTTLRPIRVGPGADFVSYPYGRVLYALKGKKTFEFWRYTMKPLDLAYGRAKANGAAGSAGAAPAARLAISPNPVTGDKARFALSSPAAGPVVVTLFDMAGRAVSRSRLDLARPGGVELDLRGLAAGAYLVRVEGSGPTVTGRVVISR